MNIVIFLSILLTLYCYRLRRLFYYFLSNDIPVICSEFFDKSPHCQKKLLALNAAAYMFRPQI